MPYKDSTKPENMHCAFMASHMRFPDLALYGLEEIFSQGNKICYEFSSLIVFVPTKFFLCAFKLVKESIKTVTKFSFVSNCPGYKMQQQCSIFVFFEYFFSLCLVKV